LKETSKHKWTGNIKPEIGYLNKYNGNVNTLNISDKIGVTVFLKLNNIGIPVISTSDHLSLQTSLLDILKSRANASKKISLIFRFSQKINYIIYINIII
jgi:hypothetical protein